MFFVNNQLIFSNQKVFFMKKFFTSLCCVAAMAAFALPTNAQNTITLGQPFDVSPSASTWDFTTTYEVIGYYISSNSSTNLLETGELEFWFGTMFAMDCFEAKQNSEGNYYYQNTSDWPKLGSGNSYQVKYSGTATIQLTLGEGTYVDNGGNGGAGGDDSKFDNPSTSGIIQVGIPFAVNSDNNEWTYSNYDENEYQGCYFESNSNVNILNELSWKVIMDIFPDGLSVDLTPQINSAGNYIYICAATIKPSTEGSYKLTYTGSESVVLIMNQGEYKEGGASTLTITLDEQFELGPGMATSGVFEFTSGEYPNLNAVYLLTNSNVNLIEAGTLDVTVYGATMVDEENWTPVYIEDKDVYAYNGVVNDGNPYTFTYSGSEQVQFTLKAGEYMAYMDYEATVLNSTTGQEYFLAPLEELQLTWGLEDITLGKGQISIWEGDASDSQGKIAYKLNETGNGLVLDMNSLADEPGTYTISIPAGIVKNSDGESNNTQKLVINVIPAAEYTVSPEAGTYGEVETVTITFEGDVTENTGFEGETGITLNGNNYPVVPDGATLTLTLDATETGTYEIVIPTGIFFVNEGEDDMAFNPEITLTYIVDETLAVSSISVVNGENAIYNLQGVRVANPQKGQIYIINGQKIYLK